MTKNQHVVPLEGDWGLGGAGNSRFTSNHKTQAAALQAARQIAIHQQSELLVNGRNCQIREHNSYGSNGRSKVG